ncbi:hypothetical protein [Rhodovulum marinum]|uniref:Uncharacterized protein n=1 Tax=Rhodovulum marinum TaxID=320662 RepID=A0A4R2Q575_9RHOB|nr:hypothetical protein [Rhodovulum marinum]TCP43973.1 hypothetical protein EV662_10158 [Rhodovulum marinum]
MKLGTKGSARPWVGAINLLAGRGIVALNAGGSVLNGKNAPSRGEGRALPGVPPGAEARTLRFSKGRV